MTVACVLIPHFSLIAAAGEREELIGKPAALAPQPGETQIIGEVSGAAETFGVRAGIGLGEALARCPTLVLIPPDPERAAELWEAVLCRLEGIGAAIESERSGEGFFHTDGLRGLYGGVGGALGAAREAIGMPVRLAAAPTRFAAYAAATCARRRRGQRRETVIKRSEVRGFLSTLPASLLGPRLDPGGPAGHELVAVLERLGIKTLGVLAELPPDAVADRFGPIGLRARRFARGEDEPLHPREQHESLLETIELPEACAGAQLERALTLLVDRLLADPVRRGRTVRALRFGARLAGGGGWQREVALRAPSASPELLRLALLPKLGELPGPASTLVLEARGFGPHASDQMELAAQRGERRRRQLGEAVRQVRAAAGPGALLRVLEVDSCSRVPERWALLTPFPETPERPPPAR